MLSICFCNGSKSWGGGEKWHLEASLSFAERNWKVFIICQRKGELYARAKKHLNLNIIPMDLGNLSFLNPLKYFFFKTFFNKHKIHSVIINLPSDLKSIAPAAKSAGVRNIIYRRGSAIAVKNSWFNRYLYSNVITRLVTNSQATKEQALVNNPNLISEKKITVLPNGININEFDQSLSAASSISSPSSFSPETIILGNAGRLNRQKGQHLLLLLGHLLQQNQVSFKILIAGTGELSSQLRQQACELGIEEHVLFTGFLEDLSPFWKAIDIFVLSSLWEGFGFVLLEAMLAQKPVMAFSVSNIPELIKNGENGLLFPLPNEPESDCYTSASKFRMLNSQEKEPLLSFAKAIIQLASNPDKRKRMGIAGRRFASSHFSQESCMDSLEQLLLQKTNNL